MTFKLTIKLGNEAMQTGSDVADALRKVRNDVDFHLPLAVGTCGDIRDLNGNIVGSWRVTRS